MRNELDRLEGYILAAGVANRTGYLGALLPKTLLPVKGKPLLWYSLLTAAQVGVSHATVVTSPTWSIVRRYVRELTVPSEGLESIRTVVLRRKTAGPVETLLRVLPRHTDDFCVVFGDDYTKGRNVGMLQKKVRQSDAMVAELVVREDSVRRMTQSCSVKLRRDGLITCIEEKPHRPKPGYRGCGVYYFRGSTFRSLVEEAVPKNHSLTMTDLVEVATRQHRAYGIVLDGLNVNVNTLGDFVTALTAEGDDVDCPL